MQLLGTCNIWNVWEHPVTWQDSYSLPRKEAIRYRCPTISEMLLLSTSSQYMSLMEFPIEDWQQKFCLNISVPCTRDGFSATFAWGDFSFPTPFLCHSHHILSVTCLQPWCHLFSFAKLFRFLYVLSRIHFFPFISAELEVPRQGQEAMWWTLCKLRTC